MTRQEFADKLVDILETEEDLTPQTELNEVEEYDSLTVLSIIAFVDKNFSKTLSANQLASVTTVNSLIDLIGADNFE